MKKKDEIREMYGLWKVTVGTGSHSDHAFVMADSFEKACSGALEHLRDNFTARNSVEVLSAQLIESSGCLAVWR
jgi:hypothetical protein